MGEIGGDVWILIALLFSPDVKNYVHFLAFVLQILLLTIGFRKRMMQREDKTKNKLLMGAEVKFVYCKNTNRFREYDPDADKNLAFMALEGVFRQ